jgi:hypothetical protein
VSAVELFRAGEVGPYSTVSSGEKKNTEVLTYRGAGVDMNFVFIPYAILAEFMCFT